MHAALFQDAEKQITSPSVIQKGLPLITTESDEVQIARAIVALQVWGHEGIVRQRRRGAL
jgi:hypothetical protein